MQRTLNPHNGSPTEETPRNGVQEGLSVHPSLFLELSRIWRNIAPLLESGTAEEPQDRLYLPIQLGESIRLRHITPSAARENEVETGTFYSPLTETAAPFELEIDFDRTVRVPFSAMDSQAALAYLNTIEEILDPGDCEGTEVLDYIDVLMDLRDLRKKLRHPLQMSKVYLSNHRLLRRGKLNQLISGFHLRTSTEEDIGIDQTQANLKPLRSSFSMDREHPWALGVENWPAPANLTSKDLQSLPSLILRKVERTFRALRNKQKKSTI